MSFLVDAYRVLYDLCRACTDSHGYAIPMLSIVTMVAVEPLALLVETMRERENGTRPLLATRLAAIRAECRGAERRARIARLYHRYSYRPVYSLHRLVGGLAQLALIHAAYMAFLRCHSLWGESFGPIVDLARPDGLFGTVNALPLAMTLTGLAAVAVGTHSTRRDHVFGAVIVGIILVLLYAAPSAMVLYWTLNNALFVLRGLAMRGLANRPALASALTGARPIEAAPPRADPALTTLYRYLPPTGMAFSFFVVAAALYPNGYPDHRPLTVYYPMLALTTVALVVMLRRRPRLEDMNVRREAIILVVPWLLLALYEWGYDAPRHARTLASYWPFAALCGLQWLRGTLAGVLPGSDRGAPAALGESYGRLYAASGCAFAALLFLIGPSLIAASEPEAFSARAPRWIVVALTVFVFMAGSLLASLWRICPRVMRPALSLLAAAAAVAALLRGTVLIDHYGALDTGMFQHPPGPSDASFWKDGAILGLTTVFLTICASRRWWRPLARSLGLVAAGGVCLSVWLLHGIGRPVGDGNYPLERFRLSRTAPNHLVVMVDGFTGEHLRDALEDVPGLQQDLSGFTWYPDTISNGSCTMMALPAMFGGIDYAPENIGRPADVSLRDKIAEAMAKLPNLCLERGGRVFIEDLTRLRMSGVPNGNAAFLARVADPSAVSLFNSDRVPAAVFDAYMERENPTMRERNLHWNGLSLAAFSLFRFAPMATKIRLYNGGKWFDDPDQVSESSRDLCAVHIAKMRRLSTLFGTDDGPATLNIVHSLMAHSPYLLGPAGLELHETRQSPYLTARHTMEMLANFFRWMRAEGLYDNTFIVVASDHGAYLTELPRHVGDQRLLNFLWTRVRPNSLLLVKPARANGPLAIDPALCVVSDIHGIVASSLTGGVPNLPPPGASPDRERILSIGDWHWSGHSDNDMVVRQRYAIRGSQFNIDNWREIPVSPPALP